MNFSKNEFLEIFDILLKFLSKVWARNRVLLKISNLWDLGYSCVINFAPPNFFYVAAEFPEFYKLKISI